MKNKRIRDTVSTLLNIVVHFYCFFLPLWASNPSSPILPKPLSSNYVVPGITISFLSAHLLFNFFPHILLAPYAFIFPSSFKELTGLIYQFFTPSAVSSEFSIAFYDMLPLFIDASTELSELFDLQNLNCLDTIWSLFFHTTFYYIISIHILICTLKKEYSCSCCKLTASRTFRSFTLRLFVIIYTSFLFSIPIPFSCSCLGRRSPPHCPLYGR